MLHFFGTRNSSGVGAMIRNEKAEVMAAMSAKGLLVGDSIKRRNPRSPLIKKHLLLKHQL